MPANTPKGYPYPLGTDRVMDGDDSIHNLASAVDTKLGVACGGQVSIPISALNTPSVVAVTFPVGLFTASPFVLATGGGGNPHQFAVSWTATTTTGVNIVGARTAGSVGALVVYWAAHQI